MPSDNLEKQIRESWDESYQDIPTDQIPWETGKPETTLVEILEKDLIKKGKALDVGCGLGTHSIYLAKNGFDITGIDISPTAIEKAKARAEKQDVQVRFLTGNAYDLKFDDQSFDFVFDRGCFHSLPSNVRSRYILGIYRVLNKEGRYLLLVFSKSNHEIWMNRFSFEDIRKLFGKHFEIVEEKEVVHTEPFGRKVFLLSVLMAKISKQ